MDDEAVNAPPSQGASQRKHLGLPMHTWVSIGIAAGVLFLTFLLWRNSRSSGAAVSAGGQGIPNFGAAGASLGDPTGNPTLAAEIDAIAAYIRNPATPNPAPSANPTGGATSGTTATSGSGNNPGTSGGSPVAQPAATLHTYTVQAGDWLSKIAPQFGETWQQLYAANKTTIDATAHAHGFYDQEFNWIFPGETLQVP